MWRRVMGVVGVGVGVGVWVWERTGMVVRLDMKWVLRRALA